jgi:hypothetical protein
MIQCLWPGHPPQCGVQRRQVLLGALRPEVRLRRLHRRNDRRGGGFRGRGISIGPHLAERGTVGRANLGRGPVCAAGQGAVAGAKWGQRTCVSELQPQAGEVHAGGQGGEALGHGPCVPARRVSPQGVDERQDGEGGRLHARDDTSVQCLSPSGPRSAG